MTEEFEREMKLLRPGPADRVVRQTGLKFLLHFLEFCDQPGFQGNRNEGTNAGSRGRSHTRFVTLVPAG